MNLDRRKFLKTSALATAAAGVAPGLMHACASPNEKIVVGLIGCNGMGFHNLVTFLKQPNVECGGLCDVDRNVLEKRSAEVEKIQSKRAILYDDYRQLIDNKDINVVINGTPDHWHTLITVAACEAGKDIYTEKPLANSIEECDLMVKAQKRYGSVIQVGQWQRSDPHWNQMVEYLRSGQMGRVRTVKAWSYVGWKGELPVKPDGQPPQGVNYDMWLGPAPDRPFNPNRFHHNFRWYWDYAGGLMSDWGVHLLDYALLGMNNYKPQSVMAIGGKYGFPNDAMQTPDTMTAVYDFGDFNIMWDHAIGIYGAKYGRGHGVEFIGEHGTLVVDRQGWLVIPETKSKGAVEGYDGVELQKSTHDGLDLHVKNFIECIKSREKPNCDVETGAKVATVSHLGNIAFRLNRKLQWNAEQQNFGDDAEANAMMKAQYHGNWKLPVV